MLGNVVSSAPLLHQDNFFFYFCLLKKGCITERLEAKVLFLAYDL